MNLKGTQQFPARKYIKMQSFTYVRPQTSIKFVKDWSYVISLKKMKTLKEISRYYKYYLLDWVNMWVLRCLLYISAV